MGRKFTWREKLLLVILAVLLVGCCYYYLVLAPTTTAIAQAQSRQNTAENQLTIETAKAINLQQMRDELAALGTDIQVAEVPDYDNAQQVMQLLNSALAAADSYSLSFSPVSIENGMARRPITMSFTSGSYDKAKAIVQTLYNAPYRCQITALSMQSTGGRTGDLLSGQVTAKLTITFYEQIPQPGADQMV